MQIDLTQVIVAIIGLLATVLTTVCIPYIRSITSSEKYNHLQVWVTVAVEAAEQIFKGTGLGSQKKEYVLKFLEEKGFKIDEKELDIMIESAVLELKHAIAE